LPAATVDLIYLDPPFNSGAVYRSGGNTVFRDDWHWDEMAQAALEAAGEKSEIGRALHALHDLVGKDGLLAYLVMLAPRLDECRRLLRATGSLCLHCDSSAGHYLKVLLDAVFGRDCFRNEIVWHYGGRGAKAVARQFPRNHDLIFVYSRSPGHHTHYHQYRERRLTGEEARHSGLRRDEQGRWFKTAPRGDYSDQSVRRLEADGRIHLTASGTVRVKYFLRQDGDVVVEDVLIGDTWLDIPDAMHLGRERTGYPTQKPELLLERIIRAASRDGDLILDPFCGSGTALVVAERLGRSWIGIDSSLQAIETTRRRLHAQSVEGWTEYSL
jgi:DNA modification methylase